jgi:hypothetical protein
MLGASVVALAAASAWMAISASPTMSSTKSTSVAQTAPASQPAPAQSATPAATPAAQPSASASSASTSSTQPADTPIAAAQQAHIDPNTGQLRPMEHDDAAKLAAQAAGPRRLARTAAAEPQQFFTQDGAVGVAVPDEVQMYTVATKTTDGKVVIQHVQGGKAAADLVKKNASKNGLSHRKEEPNDR